MTDPETTLTDSIPNVAVVTGGEGALGRALVSTLERSGRFDCILAPGRRELDVSDSGAVQDFLGELPRLDLLINNAGTRCDKPLVKMTEDEWDRVIDVNLRGAFLCGREAARKMFRQRSGHVVNIGSFSALVPPSGQGNYAAAKAGLVGMTQSFAEEFGKRGVRVNCVLPGFLEGTGMTRDLPGAVIEKARAAHVLGRFNTPGAAARFIVQLDEMQAVSGQVFQLDSRLRRW